MGFFDRILKPNKSKEKLTMSFPEEEKLEKTVKPHTINPAVENQVERSKIIFDLESGRATVDNIYSKSGRLSDKELRGVASYDSIVSLIITTRCNQGSAFGKRSRSKYNRGYLLRESVPVQDDPRIPPDSKASECSFRSALAEVISKWISNCGTTNRDILEYTFKGSDTFFKECTLSDYISAQMRNLLTYGRCATQIMRNKDGVPILWRPLPVETLYRVIDGRYVTLTGQDKDVSDEGAQDAKEWNAMSEDLRPVAYVQRINGKDVSFFTEDEIQITYYQKQAFEGLNGYPLAPIEMAYYSLLMNFYSQSYLQNSFTKGLGAKGIINLKTTEGDYLSKEDVETFRKMFSNYVARNDNSATVPVIAGAVEVEWIPLMGTAKDVEFVNLYNRVLLTVCSSFQISPHEIGFGALDPEKSTIVDGMKQDQIVQGEERGLRLLLESLFLSVYKIVEEAFPQSKGMFVLEPVGLGQNTKEGDLAIYKEELQTSGTFAKIWSDSERTEAFPFGGHVPTSPLFHQNVAKYMTFGEMRFHFFHDINAKDNPAYDFIIDPALNEAYQQLKTGALEQQKKQGELAIASQEMQLQAAQVQMQQPQQEEAPTGISPDQAAAMEMQKHQMEMEKEKAKMQMEQKKHEQELQHETEKHELNLRLAFQEAVRKQQDATTAKLQAVIQTAKQSSET